MVKITTEPRRALLVVLYIQAYGSYRAIKGRTAQAKGLISPNTRLQVHWKVALDTRPYIATRSGARYDHVI